MANRIKRNLISRLFDPFSTAESLDSYARRGYWCIGFPAFFIFFAFVWFNGLLGYTVDQLPSWAQTIVNLAAKSLNISADLSRMTVVLIATLLYLVAGLVPKTQRWFGERFANAFFGVLSKAIETGEWFIDHRKASAISIVFLTSILIAGSYYKFSSILVEAEQERNLSLWIERADLVVNKSTLSRNEPEKYRSLGQIPDIPNSISSPNSNGEQPSVVLSRMLATVYPEESTSNESTWLTKVATKVQSLEQLANTSPFDTQDAHESASQAQSLIHIIMGRVYVRSFEDAYTRPEELNDSHFKCLVNAKKHFEKALSIIEKTKKLPHSWTLRHRASINNGLGLVYSSVFSLFSRISPTNGAVSSLSEVSNICPDLNGCAERARESISLAGEGFPSCSFEDKRRMNNITDLLMRIGLNYEILSKPSSRVKTSKTLERNELAQEISKSADEMLACNSREPLIINNFITAAQAYATSTQLKISDGQPSPAEALSAAYYLRLSYNFDAENLPDWDLSPFCFLTSLNQTQTGRPVPPNLVSEFFANLERPLLGLKPLKRDFLVQKISGSGKCR